MKLTCIHLFAMGLVIFVLGILLQAFSAGYLATLPLAGGTVMIAAATVLTARFALPDLTPLVWTGVAMTFLGIVVVLDRTHVATSENHAAVVFNYRGNSVDVVEPLSLRYPVLCAVPVRFAPIPLVITPSCSFVDSPLRGPRKVSAAATVRIADAKKLFGNLSYGEACAFSLEERGSAVLDELVKEVTSEHQLSCVMEDQDCLRRGVELQLSAVEEETGLAFDGLLVALLDTRSQYR